MSDDEEYEEEEEQQEVKTPKPAEVSSGGESKAEFIKKRETKATEFEEQLAVYIEEWRKQKRKEDAELVILKEKQVKRMEIRAVEDKRMQERKKKEEERVRKEAEEKKAREQAEKMKRIEDAEKRRQLILQAEKAAFGRQRAEIDDQRREKAKMMALMQGGGVAATIDTKEEMRLALMKTKEQLAEEKEIAINIRVRPLVTEGKSADELKRMAQETFERIVKLETEKYDLEQRQIRQEYDLKELKERQKQQLRHKALKLGLEPEALIGKYPPKIRLASKFERRVDTRSYSERKTMFIDGYEKYNNEENEKLWKEKLKEFNNRAKTRLPKWFGERPGKKAGDPPTPDEEIKEIKALDDLIEPSTFEEEEPEAEEAEAEAEEEEVEEEEEEEEEE